VNTQLFLRLVPKFRIKLGARAGKCHSVLLQGAASEACARPIDNPPWGILRCSCCSIRCDSAQSVSRESYLENATIRPDDTTATLVGKNDGNIREGRKEFSGSGDFYIRLLKKNGTWSIDDAHF
jgi:hypothetical protein